MLAMAVYTLAAPESRFLNRVLLYGFADGRIVLPPLIAALSMLSLFVHGTTNDLRADFPRHLFVLPLRTGTLTAAQFVYKLLVAAALGGLIEWNFARHAAGIPAGAALVGMVLLVCAGQLLASLAGLLGLLRGIGPFVGLVAAWLVACVLLRVPVLYVLHILFGPAARVMLAVFAAGGFAVYALLLSHVCTFASRHQGGRGVPRFLPRRSARRREDTFASPWRAQHWFEFRNAVHRLLWFAGGVLALTLVLRVLVYTLLDVDFSEFEVAVTVSGLVIGLVAFGTGHYLIYATPAYRGFVFTKPMRTPQLGGAKVTAAAQGALLACAVQAAFIGLSLLDVALDGPRGAGLHYGEKIALTLGLTTCACFVCLAAGRLLLLAVVVLMLAGYPVLLLLEGAGTGTEFIVARLAYTLFFALLALAVMLAARRNWPARRYAAKLAAAVLGVFLVYYALAWVYEEDFFAAPWPVLLAVLFVAVVFGEAWSRGALPGLALACCAVVFAFGVFLLLALFGPARPTQVLPVEEGMGVAALASLLLLPVAWAPLSAHLQRHR